MVLDTDFWNSYILDGKCSRQTFNSILSTLIKVNFIEYDSSSSEARH